jgi:hypothetical protein
MHRQNPLVAITQHLPARGNIGYVHAVAQVVQDTGEGILRFPGLRIPLILISHSGRSRSPIPVILITLFTMPEEGTADSMTWRWTVTTDG